jgi:hypothetical protein
MTELMAYLALASDAVLMALSGCAFWIVAGFAVLMERRRIRKRSLDRLEAVGWFPWTPVFLSSAVIGGGLLSMSAPIVLGELL